LTIILTNDDGIGAPGIEALRSAITEETIVVAPDRQYSGCGHQVTTQSSIRVEQRSPKDYAVSGTPADCTRVAIAQLCPQIDWILSGINSGGNMGVDEYISGTVAAVREAAFHGINSIAISQYRQGKRIPGRLEKSEIDWEGAKRRTQKVLEKLMSRPCEPGTFWNVNLPALDPDDREPEIVFCRPSIRPLPLNYRIEGEYFTYVGSYQNRERTPGTDVDICFGGNIAISQLSVSLKPPVPVMGNW